MPALRDSDRVLVIDRKLFRDDNTRLFVGVVEECDEDVMRVRGYPFHLSPYEISGAERHGDERVRIISLAAGMKAGFRQRVHENPENLPGKEPKKD